MKITVIGAGSFGTTLAILLCENGHEICLYTHNKETAVELDQDRENKKYLPRIKIPQSINITSDLKKAVDNTSAVVFAVPSVAMSSVLSQVAKLIKLDKELGKKSDQDTVFIITSKGFDNQNTFSKLAETVLPVPTKNIGALSGPTHAEELAQRLPTTCVATSTSEDTANFIQDIFMNQYFRIYTNTDILGVELAGALKNVIALAAGILDGMGHGDNTKAALITRGIKEIATLGVACGADVSTFYGLAGIGDLIVTCTSTHSRNLRAGRLLGAGKTIEQAKQEIGQVIEGANAANAAAALAKKHGIDMPIVEQVNNVLSGTKTPKEAVHELMNRDKKQEN